MGVSLFVYFLEQRDLDVIGHRPYSSTTDGWQSELLSTVDVVEGYLEGSVKRIPYYTNLKFTSGILFRKSIGIIQDNSSFS
jgi:hypothetical protein